MSLHSATGSLTALGWAAEVSTDGDPELGIELDAVTTKLTCTVQHLIVALLNRRIAGYRPLNPMDEFDDPNAVVTDYLSYSVNGITANIKLEVTFKVATEHDDREYAKELIGVVLAKVSANLAAIIADVSLEKFEAHMMDLELDDLLGHLGLDGRVPDEMLQVIREDFAGRSGMPRRTTARPR